MTKSSPKFQKYKPVSLLGWFLAILLGVNCLPLLVNSQSEAATISFGYIPASPEQFSQQPEAPRYRAFLPAKVDLSPFFPTPGLQGMMNSCTGWAVGYAARSYYALRQENRDIRQLQNIPSPNYIYQSIRLSSNCASGGLLLDSFRLLQTGSLSYTQFPIESCARPSDAQRSQASQFKIRNWLAIRPDHIDDIKGQIAKGNPVIIGIEVKKSLETLSGDEIYRGAGEQVGFHALTIVGYDEQRQAFKVINSWGTNWANGGFGWIEYGVILHDVREAYIIEIDPKRIDAAQNETRETVKPPKPQDTTVDIISPRVVIKPKPKPDQSDESEVTQPIDRPITDSDCSDVRWEDVGKTIHLTGYAPTNSDIDLIERANKGKPIEVKIDLRPWPQCEVLNTLGRLLNKPDAPRLVSAKLRYSEGDPIMFELTTPKRPSYLYVSYIQTDGEVITLYQPSSALAPAKSEDKIVFGDGSRGSPRYRVTKPYGRETVVAVAAESPLFEGALPRRMTEREYLSVLRKAILYKADPAEPNRNIAAAFLGLETIK